MRCQILFSRKNKKNIISLSSAESAHGMVSINLYLSVILLLNNNNNSNCLKN